jgi:hypothetical protein
LLNQIWNRQAEHTGCFHPKVPVYSTCLFFMSGSKLGWNHRVCSTCLVQQFRMESFCMFNLNSIQNCWTRYEIDKLNIQGVSIQKFWTRHEEQTIWTYGDSIQKFWTRHEVLTNWTWFKTFRWNLPLCLMCKYFLSGSKLLDGITLYVELGST